MGIARDPNFRSPIISDNNMEQRFWSKIDKSGECWEWTGKLHSSGYGLIRQPHSGPFVKTHRYSAYIHYGDLGTYLVCHICDNRKCVNPEHLYLGSESSNRQDMWDRGRRFRPTHCSKGHPMTEENLYWNSKTKERRCKTCSLNYSRNRRKKGD